MYRSYTGNKAGHSEWLWIIFDHMGIFNVRQNHEDAGIFILAVKRNGGEKNANDTSYDKII